MYASGRNASESWVRWMRSVTVSSMSGRRRNSLSSTSASTMAAATRSAAELAAHPASWSPERIGDAFAITSVKEANE